MNKSNNSKKTHDVCELQGGKDPYDALDLQVIFRKRALKLVTLLRKRRMT